MTHPHQHNCAHSDDGWCLSCVEKLGKQLEEIENALDVLPRWKQALGYVEISECLGRWKVSNKTDEGIGSDGPRIDASGKTPLEALKEAAKFLADPQIPAPLTCPNCGAKIPVGDYEFGIEIRIHYWCHSCYEGYSEDDICPECFSALEVIRGEDDDPMRTKWEAKCKKCGKVFPRGDVEMLYPKFPMEEMQFSDGSGHSYDYE